jgi:pimeloyl-ACP methyl ester carboxylesterase
MTWYLIFLALAAGLAATRMLQVVGERRDARRSPPPGRMIGAAGCKLHLLVKGSAAGPTVVIEQGAGGVGALWGSVQDAVAKFATALTYDRRGLGWSDPAISSRSVDQRVEDLRELLRAAAVSEPYLFVAHSYGGLLVRLFARKYPDLTAGLVLVDSLEEGVHFHPEVSKLYRGFSRMLLAIAALQFLGLPRLWRMLVPDRGAASDPRRAALAAMMLRPSTFLAMREDFDSLARLPADRRQSWPAGIFGDLPLLVVTHGQPFPGPFAVLEKHWTAGQERLAALSTTGELVVAARSSHMIQDDEPQVVVDAIRRVYAAATDGQPGRAQVVLQ